MPVDSQYYQAKQAQPDREAEQVEREQMAPPDAEGRWQKGVSGNPGGRRRRLRPQLKHGSGENNADLRSRILRKSAVPLT